MFLLCTKHMFVGDFSVCRYARGWVWSPQWQKTNSLSQTTDISLHRDKRLRCFPACLCVCLVYRAGVGSVANHSASFTWPAEMLMSWFSETAHLIWVNVNMFRAGARRWQRDWWSRPLKGPVCMCVVFVSWFQRRTPHRPTSPSICGITPQKPACQMWSSSTRAHHPNMVIDSHAT